MINGACAAVGWSDAMGCSGAGESARGIDAAGSKAGVADSGVGAVAVDGGVAACAGASVGFPCAMFVNVVSAASSFGEIGGGAIASPTARATPGAARIASWPTSGTAVLTAAFSAAEPAP